MEFDNQWGFAGLEIFWYQDAHVNAMLPNLLERGAVNAKAVKARCWSSIVKGCHVAAELGVDVDSRAQLVPNRGRRYRSWLSNVEVCSF